MTATDDPALRAAVTWNGAEVVITLSGELDLATADRLRTRLQRVVEADPPPARVVLDVAALDFVDAAGIAVLLSAQRTLAARGGRMSLRSPSRLVRRVVRVLDLGHLLPVDP